MEEYTYDECFVCGVNNPYGLKLTFRYENGAALAETMIPAHFAGYPGVVHGGIVSALLDEIMAKAIEQTGVWSMTANLEVRFRKPTPTGTGLSLRGEIVKGGGKIFRTKATITLEDGTVAAEATGVFVRRDNL
ncbi:PaaI family thioesterase [Paradesulfitobacterium ferrireducens]|uniref:PaaI family thioesterase n=1 Tax=Paradesulfitobacterium ferrireducens TaxID=2816476 RepID=UPI001A8D2D1E|nr:PaaI family thioesterase [Paradesulfitobacterium ferrireducens]